MLGLVAFLLYHLTETTSRYVASQIHFLDSESDWLKIPIL